MAPEAVTAPGTRPGRFTSVSGVRVLVLPQTRHIYAGTLVERFAALDGTRLVQIVEVATAEFNGLGESGGVTRDLMDRICSHHPDRVVVVGDDDGMTWLCQAVPLLGAALERVFSEKFVVSGLTLTTFFRYGHYTSKDAPRA